MRRLPARRGRSGSIRRTTSQARAGFEDVRSVTCKGKTGVVVFKKVYAGRRRFSTPPASGLLTSPRGQDANKLWDDSIPVSSGPWRFQAWQKGVQITVAKNPRFTIAPMKLDRVVFRYIA